MKIGVKLLIAFIATALLTVLLAFVVPDESVLLGLPGTLFIIFVVSVVYRKNQQNR